MTENQIRGGEKGTLNNVDISHVISYYIDLYLGWGVHVTIMQPHMIDSIIGSAAPLCINEQSLVELHTLIASYYHLALLLLLPYPLYLAKSTMAGEKREQTWRAGRGGRREPSVHAAYERRMVATLLQLERLLVPNQLHEEYHAHASPIPATSGRCCPRHLPQMRHHLAQGPRLHDPKPLPLPHRRRRPPSTHQQPSRTRAIPRATSPAPLPHGGT
jgi:hypothetical protein